MVSNNLFGNWKILVVSNDVLIVHGVGLLFEVGFDLRKTSFDFINLVLSVFLISLESGSSCKLILISLD